MKLSVKLLDANNNLINEISNIIMNEWGEMHNLKSISRSLINEFNNDNLPQTYIVFDNDIFVGFFSIWRCDTIVYQDVLPWLANVYVFPKYRNLGIGRYIQKMACDIAKNNNFDKIYLWTDLKGYYEKTNWNFIEKFEHENGFEAQLFFKQIGGKENEKK